MISVIVLNWNGSEHLEECLSSLSHSHQVFQDYEVVLVDNGSTDGSLELVRRLFPWVRVLALGENLGFCKANNAGIQESQGDLVALLNNDTRVDARWLQALGDCAARRTEIGFFASKMLLYHDNERIDDAGDEFHTAGFVSKRGWLEADGAEFACEREVFGASAGAALYRRSMLDDVGLLDEHFFANGEDVDLSFRAQLRGYRCLFVPDAIVFHKGGASIGQTGRWFYWIRRNQLWVMVKDMPWQLLIKYLPEIVVYNLTSLVYHSLRGRGRLIWRAYFDAFRGMRGMMAQRTSIQSRKTVSAWDVERILTRGSLWHRLTHPITRQETFRRSYRV